MTRDARPEVSGGEGLAIHRRIRQRRRERGMAAYELADRVRISPSYVSLIENGTKVPAEDVAVRIAHALEDDPELYVAWARTSRYGDLETTLSGLRRLRSYTRDPGLRDRIESGENLPDPDVAAVAAAPSRAAPRPEGDVPAAAGAITLVEVPVLREGSDPGEHPAASGAVVETLRLDRRLLPGETPDGLFAYRPGAETARRIRDRIAPGDLVVLTTRALRPSSDRIRALRLPRSSGIVLARALLRGRALLVLPSDRSGEIEVVDLEGRDTVSRIVAGTAVMTVTWS